MTRPIVLAAAWLAGVSVLTAQTPPAGQPPLGAPTAPPAAAPAPTAPPAGVPPEVWHHLSKWEAVMKTAQNFYTKGTKTVENKTNGRSFHKDYELTVMCLMPSKARMNLTAIPEPGKPADPYDYEAYISNEKVILEYSGNDKKLTETRLPPGGVKGHLLIDFLSGTMTAKAAVERFTIKLRLEDANYIYLQLEPKFVEDAEEFATMILTLYKDVPGQAAYLPVQVGIYKSGNQYQETYSFKSPAINIKGVKPEYFDSNVVAVDKSWKHDIQYAPAQRPMKPVGVPAAIPGPGGPAVVPTPGGPPPQ